MWLSWVGVCCLCKTQWFWRLSVKKKKDISYPINNTFYLIICWKDISNRACAQSFSHVWVFATLLTIACQAPLSMGFSGKNTGVACHFLLQGIFPTQELNKYLMCFLHCKQILYPLRHWRSSIFLIHLVKNISLIFASPVSLYFFNVDTRTS